MVTNGKRYKIGLLLETKPTDGGTFQYCLSVLQAVVRMPQSKFEIVIIYTHKEWEPLLKKHAFYKQKVERKLLFRVLDKFFHLLNLPIEVERKVSSIIHPLSRALVQKKCDLWVFPAADRWVYKTSVPGLVTIYDLMHRYERRFPEVSAKGIFEWREQHYEKICAYAKGVLVDSRIGKNQVMESYGIDANKVHILPFVPPQYIYDKKMPTGFDDRYPALKKFLFYPAQYWEHKNHKSLIKAVALLRKKYPDLSFIFVGSRYNGFESSYKMIEEFGLTENIQILEYIPRDDMPEFYRRAHGMIMPTFFGPTNIPPLEANALGCPVAVSDIYGMREQLGKAAIFFNPLSVEDIANAIEIIWVDEKQRIELRNEGFKRDKVWNQVHFNIRLSEIIEDLMGQILS